MTPTLQSSPFGSANRLHPHRAPFEFYPTPPQGIRALLSVETFENGKVVVGEEDVCGFHRKPPLPVGGW